MKRGGPSLLVGSAVLAGVAIVSASEASRLSRAAAGAYTAAQSQAGQAAYAQQCAGCHSADFRGSGDAPAVVGPDFIAKWGPRAVNDLFTFVVQTMPPTNPGALGEAGTLDGDGIPAPDQRGTRRPTAVDGDGFDADERARHRAASCAGIPCAAAGGRGAMPPVLGAGTGRRPGSGWSNGESRRDHSRRGEELRTGHLRDAQEPAAERLADVPRQLLRPQLQPAESDHASQREEPATAMGVGDERLGRQPDDTDRPQRRDLSGEPEQFRSGARWKDGRLDLGNARRPGSGAGLRRHSQHRDCRRQDPSAGEQRAHGGAQCPHRRDSLGHARSAGRQPRQHQRRDRDRRQGAAGAHRMQRVSTVWAATSVPTTSRPASRCGASTPFPARASQAARRGESCR